MSIIKETCPICYDELDSTSITLKCNHTFHYDCILNSFKSSITKNTKSYNSYKWRKCPYCREDGGYLPLRNNIYPFNGIHLEYYEIEQCLLRNDFDKLKIITEQYIVKTNCNAIIKTGINKGYQCKKNKKKNLDYCHLHG